MLFATINAAFALMFGTVTHNALRRGWHFSRSGWQIISAEALQNAGHDPRKNVESRRILSAGGTLMIGGVLWLGAALIAGGFTVFFSVEALRYSLGLA